MTAHYGRESFALERKDESGGQQNAVAIEVKREIDALGGDIKSLKDSLQKDLADIRKIAEDAKGASPDLEQKLAALSKSVIEKQDALTKEFEAERKRADDIEVMLKRAPLGTDTKSNDDAVKAAVAFFEAKAASTGSLKWRDRPSAKTIDLDGYKGWEAAFGTYLRAKDEREIDVKALSVGSNPDGGYLVPTARSARIVTKIFESSPLRQLSAVETIGTEALEIPIDVGEAACGWVGEEETRSTTATPQVGVQRIPVHEMYAKPKATQQLLEDASIDIEGWLSGKIADKMGRTEATAFVSGTGVKQPRGILTYTAGSAGARGTIKQVASGAATAITGDVIVKMPTELKAPYLGNAVWLMKRSTVQAVMLLKDGQGQYLWRPGLDSRVPSTLAGYPLYMADDMPAVGAGLLPMAFGDFRAGYTVVDRLGITTLRDPYSAKPFVEFYTRRRVGGDVVDFEAFALVVVSAS